MREEGVLNNFLDSTILGILGPGTLVSEFWVPPSGPAGRIYDIERDNLGKLEVFNELSGLLE